MAGQASASFLRDKRKLGILNQQAPKRSKPSGLHAYFNPTSPSEAKGRLGREYAASRASEAASRPCESSAFSADQREAMGQVRRRHNVFITGCAGSGKSFLLKEIVKVLPRRTTFVTASSGIAACNIGGITLHSFAGVGLGKEPVPVLVKRVLKGRAKRRWLQCRTLVIDEISMISGELFTKIEEVARHVRKDTRPFGGIQLVICGDFLQLPPVAKGSEAGGMCFECDAWRRVVDVTVNLRKVFRQRDEGFVDMLNRMRLGQLGQRDLQRLDALQHTRFPKGDGISPTVLFPDRSNRMNSQKLRDLRAPAVTFSAADSGRPDFIEKMDKNGTVSSRLVLKAGSQVILLKNIDVPKGLVNGAKGVVLGFRRPASPREREAAENHEQRGTTKFPCVRFTTGEERLVTSESWTTEMGGEVVAERVQIPLSLAWAISIHKSQGMTLDRVVVSLKNVFEDGQAYVALSRARSPDGILVQDYDARRVRANDRVLAFYKTLSFGATYHKPGCSPAAEVESESEPHLWRQHCVAQPTDAGETTRREAGKGTPNADAGETNSGSTSLCESSQQQFEVKAVLDSRLEGGSRFYLLEWMAGEPTWELEGNLNCPDLLREYEERTAHRGRDVAEPQANATSSGTAAGAPDHPATAVCLAQGSSDLSHDGLDLGGGQTASEVHDDVLIAQLDAVEAMQQAADDPMPSLGEPPLATPPSRSQELASIPPCHLGAEQPSSPQGILPLIVPLPSTSQPSTRASKRPTVSEVPTISDEVRHRIQAKRAAAMARLQAKRVKAQAALASALPVTRLLV